MSLTLNTQIYGRRNTKFNKDDVPKDDNCPKEPCECRTSGAESTGRKSSPSPNTSCQRKDVIETQIYYNRSWLLANLVIMARGRGHLSQPNIGE